ASTAGMRARENGFRHLLTIWRGVSRRVAMTRFDNPSSERRMILAPSTSQYRGVYLRAIDSSVFRSSLERSISNGLLRGASRGQPLMQAYQIMSPIRPLEDVPVLPNRSP